MLRRLTGQHWEKWTESFLQRQGLTTVARNFSSRWGEIDLVMKDRDTVVFVEVRFRRNSAFGGAAASVNRHKQQKLIRTAEFFLQRHPRWAEHPCRFDVVAVDQGRQTGPAEWIKNAFTL